jgi:hypothetical protein
MYLIRGANGIPSIVWDRLQPVRALFPDAQVIPVGNRAEEALKKVCVALPKVPHPANRRGGIALFRKGLRERVERARPR